MLRSRFLWQLGASFGAVVLVSTLVFGFIISEQMQKDTRAHIRQSLQEQASLLRHIFVPFLRRGQSITSERLRELTSGTGNRVTIIDAGGVVLADNRENPARMDNHGDRPEVLMAKSQGSGSSERHSATLDQNMLYVATRVNDESGRLLGFIRVSVPLVAVDEQLAHLRNRIFLSAALIGGFCLILVGYLARRLTRPITDMTAIATRLTHGEYNLRLPVTRDDEIGHLSSALNELARETRDRIDDLTHNRNQLAAILAGLSEGVVAVDLDQRIVHINDVARQMLNLTDRDVVGVPLWEVVRVSEINQVVDTCLRESTNVDATVAVTGRTLDVSAVMMRGDSGRADGAIVVLQDITEMLHLEKVRSDFVANASHELKTPISAIRGLIETIADDPHMPAEVLNEFVGRINNQARRLDQIVQDLIHLSRFDAEARAMTLSRVDVGALLKRLFETRREDAEARGDEFVLDLPDAPVEVDGDQEALDQMVVNLIDNAIKYTGRDGRVELRLSTFGSMAVIEVEDNGIGIALEEQQRIFERFYRVDKGRSRDLGGTGLGLSIVKHIARSHHGSVTVESKPGQGSVFSVRIPLARGG